MSITNMRLEVMQFLEKNVDTFVDNYLMAKDARELRNYYSKVSPDIELKYYPEDENYTGEGIEFPISINFFWPDVKL